MKILAVASFFLGVFGPEMYLLFSSGASLGKIGVALGMIALQIGMLEFALWGLSRPEKAKGLPKFENPPAPPERPTANTSVKDKYW